MRIKRTNQRFMNFGTVQLYRTASIALPIAYDSASHALIFPNPHHAPRIVTLTPPAWKRAHLN